MIKPGINKALVCKKCGHKMGFITIKPRFNRKLVAYGLGIALVIEIIAQSVSTCLFFGGCAQ